MTGAFLSPAHADQHVAHVLRGKNQPPLVLESGLGQGGPLSGQIQLAAVTGQRTHQIAEVPWNTPIQYQVRVNPVAAPAAASLERELEMAVAILRRASRRFVRYDPRRSCP